MKYSTWQWPPGCLELGSGSGEKPSARKKILSGKLAGLSKQMVSRPVSSQLSAANEAGLHEVA